MGDNVVTGDDEAPDDAADTLYTLGYASTETAPLSTADLLELLNQARQFNLAHGITGLLLHRDNSFLQVVEGPKAELMALYERIKRDPRHQRVEILFEEPIAEREFSDWQMAFIDLDGIDVSMLPGFSDFLMETDKPRSMLERLSRGKRLMLLFRSLA
jgi:hypothetical protein